MDSTGVISQNRVLEGTQKMKDAQALKDYLVLVHGALTDGSMWLPHSPYLEPTFEVVRVDLSHFDKPAKGGFGLNTHAEELAAHITPLLTQKPVHVVGWSYGADVVLNMLATTSLAIATALLYEPGYPGCVPETAMQAWSSDANAMFGPVFAHFTQGHLAQAVAALIDGSGAQVGYFEAQAETVKNLQLSKAYTLTQQLQQQEQAHIDPAHLANLSVPLHFAYGERSRALFKLATRYAAQAAQAPCLTLPGEGHMLPQEKPDVFARHIQTILKAAHTTPDTNAP